MFYSKKVIDSEIIDAIAKIDRSRLKSFMHRFERNHEDVEDIIQNGFVEILACAENVKVRTSARAWIYGVMANTARHHVAERVKASTRNVYHDSFSEGLPSASDANNFSSMAVLEYDPCQMTELRQTAGRLSRAIDKMPLDLRSSFDLACIQGLSYQLVALMHGVPIGTIRSRVSRARFLLRKIM